MINVNDKDLGRATAYAYAVSKGYTGTEEEFAQLMANYATVGQTATEAAEQAASSAEASGVDSLKSEGYSVGKQNGEDVEEGSPYYHNNAKYYAEEAKDSETNAGNSESAASDSASDAEANALKSEGFAVGEQDGTAVTSGSPYYQNNSKYYSEQSAASAATSAAMTGLAPAFSTSKAYAAGDYVLYNGTLYRFTAAHAAGAWTGSDATAVTLGPDVTDLKSALSDNYKRTNVGQYTPLLEVGDVNFANNTITYRTRTYRVRTKEGTYQDLKAGDVVKLSTYTDARFNAFWKVGSIWYSSGWRSTDYTLSVDSDSYIFVLANVAEDTSVVYTDPSQIGFTIIIEDNHSAKAQIVDVSDRMSEIESVFNKSDIVSNNFSLKSGRLYCYYGQILSGGVARIISIPANTRVGFQGYSDSAYKTKVYDNGWITSTPHTDALDAELYYMVMIVNYDYSAITDASIANNFVMYHDYNINGQINENMIVVERGLDNRELYQSNTVKSIAHRGDYVTAPQCTKPAYVLARKNGFRYAENDVNITLDNKYVMWHDTTLSRLGTYLVDISGYDLYTDGSIFYYYDADNTQLYTYEDDDYVESLVDVQTLTRCAADSYGVTSLNLAVLKRIDFGVYKGAEYKGTTILTFAEWVMLCKMLGMELYIDSKIGYTQERVNNLVDIVRLFGMLDKATWINITTTTVADYVRNADPNARLAILENPTDALVATFAPYNTGRGFFFNGNAKTITAEAVEKGLAAGFEVEAYYVDYTTQTYAKTIERITEFISYGVTGLTLDAFRVEDIIDSL